MTCWYHLISLVGLVDQVAFVVSINHIFTFLEVHFSWGEIWINFWCISCVWREGYYNWSPWRNSWWICKCLPKSFFWESIWKWSSLGISLSFPFERIRHFEQKTLSSKFVPKSPINRPWMTIHKFNQKMWLLADFLKTFHW